MSISVCIPVGPFESNKRWLRECIDSCLAQSIPPDDIVLIDDGAELDKLDWLHVWPSEYNQWSAATCGYSMEQQITVYKMPWRTGVSHGFNYGVMLSPTDCVFMLGSDDTIEPLCLERCLASWYARDKADGYYSVPIRYMDTGDVQTAPCNAAMVTKGFWRRTGGFPIETAIGVGDSTLLSICLANKLPVYWVGYPDQEPLYNYRRHPDIYTYKTPWHIADPLRNYLTETWSEEAAKQWSEKY